MNHFYKFNFLLDEKFDQYKTLNATLPLEIRNQFYDDISSFSNEIFTTMGSQKSNFDLLDMWINHYFAGDFNEMHSHNGEEYQQKCDYTGILILDVGENENLIVYDEQNIIQNNYILSVGDCFVVRNDILHGLEQVNDHLIAAMFMVKT